MNQTRPFKILGVDPGTRSLGFAVVVVDREILTVQKIGVIRLDKFRTQQEKLKEIYLQLQEVIETYLPNYMAIESPFYGKNVQSMLKLGRAQGVAIAAGITMGLDITEYSPKKIKMSITGNGNASKEQVSGMLDQLLSFRTASHSLDATDALAVAMTHYHNFRQLSNGRKLYKNWKSYLNDHSPDSLK